MDPDQVDAVALLGIFKSWVEVVPNLVRDELQTRGQLRVKQAGHRIDQQMEQLRLENEQVRMRESSQLQAEARRLENLTQRYPLGEPGRLSEQLSPSIRPVILVSPIPNWIGSRAGDLSFLVDDILHGIQGFDAYADMLTGAWVMEDGQLRLVEGVVAAREIALREFTTHPAIIVYFQRPTTRSTTAIAYLTSIFRSMGDDAGFPFVIARYRQGRSAAGREPARRRDTDLLAWEHVDLRGRTRTDSEEIIAHTIAWFLAATLDVYWQLQGVQTKLLAGLQVVAEAGTELREQVEALLPAPDDGVAFRSLDRIALRIDQELLALEASGCEVSVGLIGEDKLGIVAQQADRSLAYLLDVDYPRQAPKLYLATDEGGTELKVEDNSWSAERTLVELWEALT